MLSIQVHPSKAAAEKEFARENAEGVPLDSPARNYKDDNHKPELIVALSDFWLLHGFKPTEELVYTLLNVVELRELLPVFNESGYAGLYKYVMEMPQEEVNRILQPLLDNITTTYTDNEPEKSDEDFWAARAAATYNRDGNIDRGIFSIYFFNLVQLKKGEGIFQDKGVPHAYLEGQNVEIMANSDNVLRGGLTSKHIDVTELLKHVKCEATFPQVMRGEKLTSGEKIYQTPVADFQLSVFEPEAGEIFSFTPASEEILLLTDGIVEVDDDKIALKLEKGNPTAIVFPGQLVYIAAAAKSTVFRASAPVNNRE
jgi:mannose-6-phosphate isomerase